MEKTWYLRSLSPGLKETKRILLQRHRMHEGDLILVNKRHPVNMHPTELTPLPAGTLQAVTLEEPFIQLERTCSLLLSSLIDRCGGDRDIAVVSGYRSMEAQDLLYLNSLKEHGEEFTSKYVALPGASEHQTGLAVDVGLSRVETDYISPAFPDEGASGRFRKIASEFGFIRRYQANKSAITGIAEEPWHYRYVGYPHSIIIDRENFCLEEYTDYLKQFHYGIKHLWVEAGNSFYEIYFTAAEEVVTPIAVPANCSNWLISGNNVDGYIITAQYA